MVEIQNIVLEGQPSGKTKLPNSDIGVFLQSIFLADNEHPLGADIAQDAGSFGRQR
jgi:hypothetical protein